MANLAYTGSEVATSLRGRDLLRVGSRAVDAEVGGLRQQGRAILRLLPHPEIPLPPHVVEAAMAAVQAPTCPPSRGLPALCQAIASSLGDELRVMIDPEKQVLVTNGAMQALFVAFAALLDPGDEILVPAPCFFLDGIADLLGIHLRFAHLDEDNGYRWDHELLAAAISPHTRAIFVNTPQNPTGYVLTADDLRFVAELAEKHNLWIISDESYDRMVYDERQHLSILADPAATARTVLIRSFTKSYAMAEWRVGYLVGPSPAIEVMVKVFEWQTLYGNAVCQAAAAAALSGPKGWLAGVSQQFQANRDLLCAAIEVCPGLTCVKPQGTPFVFLNVAGLGLDGNQFGHSILRDQGIACTPGSTMQSANHVRMAFGGDPEVIAEAGRRLQAAAAVLKTQYGVR